MIPGQQLHQHLCLLPNTISLRFISSLPYFSRSNFLPLRLSASLELAHYFSQGKVRALVGGGWWVLASPGGLCGLASKSLLRCTEGLVILRSAVASAAGLGAGAAAPEELTQSEGAAIVDKLL